MFSGLIGWHVLIVLMVGVVPFVLWVIALVQIALSRTIAGYVVGWIAIATLVPVIGPVLWLTLGRSKADAYRAEQGTA